MRLYDDGEVICCVISATLHHLIEQVVVVQLDAPQGGPGRLIDGTVTEPSIENTYKLYRLPVTYTLPKSTIIMLFVCVLAGLGKK